MTGAVLVASPRIDQNKSNFGRLGVSLPHVMLNLVQHPSCFGSFGRVGRCVHALSNTIPAAPRGLLSALDAETNAACRFGHSRWDGRADGARLAAATAK